MRFIAPIIVFVLFYNVLNFNPWSSAASAIWIAYFVNFLANVNKEIAFRQYILVMYGLNYLFSPALTYEVTQSISIYKMKLTPDEYFALAIPAIFCFHAGLYSIKTKIFKPDFSLNALQFKLNEKVLKIWLIGGTVLGFISSSFPGDLAFIVYLLCGVRYIGAFGLFILDRKKYKWYLVAIVLLEVANSLRVGMFHDLTIWMLFFGMLWTYLYKPGQAKKIVLCIVAFLYFFILQSTKGTYREAIRQGDSGFGSFSDAITKKEGTEGGGLFNFENLANSITRANQGWIFASSVNKMNFKQNYQGMYLVGKYAEAAILPRFLAPNKLEAGDKAIFNEFSGAKIATYSSTSMGLGIMADGYISYGGYGTFIFVFALGLTCAITFNIIQKWAKISPLFVLFFFPLLNFAVRADCETQTIMGHIVKGLVTFSVLMYYVKRYFKKQTIRESIGEVEETDSHIEPLPQLVPNSL